MTLSSKKRRAQKNIINVSIQFSETKIEVGTLIMENRLVHFKYKDEFLTRGMNLSPIKLQFNNNIQIANPDPFQGIFGVFDELFMLLRFCFLHYQFLVKNLRTTNIQKKECSLNL